MNPLTAIRSMLEAMGEGQRKQAFGFDYREKAEAVRARTEAERARMEQEARLFPAELETRQLATAKARAEQAQRFALAIRHGRAGDEAGAAETGAEIADLDRASELQAREAQTEASRASTASSSAKLPGAEVPMADYLARKLRGSQGPSVGPPQPLTNADLDVTTHLRDQEQRASEHRQTLAAMRDRAQIGAGGRAGGGGATGNTPSEVLDVAGRAIMSLSKPRQAAAWDVVNRLTKVGRTDEVKDVVRQLAVEGELADDKRLITGRYRMVRGLIGIRDTLRDMQTRGVPMDLLSGSAEDVLRKLGQTSDPEYVRLGARLNDMLITYRRASTGVAFGEKEGKQYEALMPNYWNAYEVNFAQIDGLLQAMGGYDRSFWEFKLGPQGAIFAGAVEGEGDDMGGTAAVASSRALGGGGDLGAGDGYLPSGEKASDFIPEDMTRSGFKLQRNRRTGEERWVPK